MLSITHLYVFSVLSRVWLRAERGRVFPANSSKNKPSAAQLSEWRLHLCMPSGAWVSQGSQEARSPILPWPPTYTYSPRSQIETIIAKAGDGVSLCNLPGREDLRTRRGSLEAGEKLEGTASDAEPSQTTRMQSLSLWPKRKC